MDSDDVAVKNRFEMQMDYLEKNPNLDILGGYIQEYDQEMKRKIAVRKVPLGNQEIHEEIGKQCPFNHTTVIFRKEAVMEVGNYQAKPIEDYRLWIQMCLNNCQMANLPEILVNFRTSLEMYQRRTGLKYLHEIKKIQDILLKEHFINVYQYIKNIILRSILAVMPCRMKKYIYPKVVRKM